MMRSREGRGTLRGFAFAAALTLVLAAPASALDNAADTSDWVTDGTVYAVAHGAGHTYIGGNFTHVGPRTGVGAPIGADGAVAGPFPEVAGGQIYAVAPYGGGWYIGGDFTSVGGVARKGLAYIKDGAVDITFNPAPNGAVRTIAVSEQAPDAGVVYIGGDFTQVHGTTRAHAAAVDGVTGTVATNWNPAPDEVVYSIAETHFELTQADGLTKVPTPLVVLGGAFNKAGSGATPSSALLAPIWGVGSVGPGTPTDPAGTSNSGTAPAWNPGIAPTGTAVRAVALDTKLPEDPNATGAKVSIAVYAGGDFTSPAGLGVKGFQVNVAPDASTATPPVFSRKVAAIAYSAWSFPVNCPAEVTPCAKTVRALALSGDKLYVGGDFGKVGNTDAERLTVVGAVDLTSGSPIEADPWTPTSDAPVRSLAVGTDGTTVYAAGAFTTLGKDASARARYGLAAIDSTSGVASDWDPKAAGGTSNVVAVKDSTVYAGGSFTSLGAHAVDRLAALDGNGALDTGFSARADGDVHALALSPDESTLYVGGGFVQINDADRHHLAAVDPASGALREGWAPDLDGWALALEPMGSKLYVGGSFTHVGGTERQHVAALDAVSAAVTDWNPGADDSVRAIEASCGSVYLGGSFAHVGGVPRGRIAAVATDGTVASWDPGDLGVVYALVSRGDDVYVGGSFSLMGGAIRHGIAKLDRSTGKARTTWSPTPESPPIVRALALAPDGGTVYSAGSFVRMADKDRGRLAAIDAVTGAATTWDPEADAPAYAIVTSGDAIFAGGAFHQVGNAMQQSWGSWNAAGALAGPAPQPPCPVETSGSSPPPTPVETLPAPPPAPVKHRAPRLAVRHFKASPARFRPGKSSAAARAKVKAEAKAEKKKPALPTGTAFVFDLTRKAKVEISIHKELFGRRKGKECVAGHRRRGRPCTRYQLYGRLSKVGARRGYNSVEFSAMFGHKELPAGIYTAKLTATRGKRSISRLTRFQVIRP